MAAAPLRVWRERDGRRLRGLEEPYLCGLMSSRDANEGPTAFLEKGSARWEDRQS